MKHGSCTSCSNWFRTGHCGFSRLATRETARCWCMRSSKADTATKGTGLECSGGTSLSQRGGAHTSIVVLCTSSEFIEQGRLSSSLSVQLICNRFEALLWHWKHHEPSAEGQRPRYHCESSCSMSKILRWSARCAACNSIFVVSSMDFRQMIAFNMSHVGKGRTLSTPACLLRFCNSHLQLDSSRGWDDSVSGLRLQLGGCVSLAFRRPAIRMENPECSEHPAPSLRC